MLRLAGSAAISGSMAWLMQWQYESWHGNDVKMANGSNENDRSSKAIIIRHQRCRHVNKQRRNGQWRKPMEKISNQWQIMIENMAKMKISVKDVIVSAMAKAYQRNEMKAKRKSAWRRKSMSFNNEKIIRRAADQVAKAWRKAVIEAAIRSVSEIESSSMKKAI